jgi:hypothetical protein
VGLLIVNTNNLKFLVELYSSLDESRQKALIGKAMVLQIEMKQETFARSNNEKIDKKELSKRTNEGIELANSFVELFKKLNEDKQAAALILMNEFADGKLATEDTLTINIESKEISVEDFVSRYVPDADVNNARKIVSEVKKNTKP